MSTDTKDRLHIRIEGDSWGCGVWDFEGTEYKNVHPGLQYFLEEEGFKVTNFSKPGGEISTCFQEPQGNEDLVLLFLTDPLRDLETSMFSSYSELVLASKILLQQFFKKIEKSSSFVYGYPIMVLGGCSKVPLDIIKNYPKFSCLTPSILEFLYPEYKHPTIWFSDWLNEVDSRFSLEDLDLLIADKKAQDSIFDGPFVRYTVPDGRHPNIDGFKKLAQFYIPILKRYESNYDKLV